MYADDSRFRKRIVMEQHRYGRGSYAYFANPLPPLVREMRSGLYRRLRSLATRWMRDLGRDVEFAPSLRGFQEQCAAAGQVRPTPLLLHYAQDGFNCLHQDRYGEVAFPLQAVVALSRRGRDYDGASSCWSNSGRASSRGGTRFRSSAASC